MKLIMELMELALYDIVQIATVALELFGIAVLVFTAVKCFIRWLRKDHENIRLELAQGSALALEFKIGAPYSCGAGVVRAWDFRCDHCSSRHAYIPNPLGNWE